MSGDPTVSLTVVSSWAGGVVWLDAETMNTTQRRSPKAIVVLSDESDLLNIG
jgi:hypothetical protein